MPTAEIIAIGSELLLGESQDTNTCFLLKNFRKIGIDVYHTQIIGDNVQRISDSIKEALSTSDIVITTGGLGPTIDDPTRIAVATAFDCDLIYKEELWQNILNYFSKISKSPSINNKRQAYIPAAAKAIDNPTGTAPAFYISRDNKVFVSLPGVPREMKFIWEKSVVPLLVSTFDLKTCILMRVLHCYGIGESEIDEVVGDMEKSKNPTLGLCARHGQIDLRIVAKSDSIKETEFMVDIFEKKLLSNFGDYIFGKDEETIFSVLNKMLIQKSIKLSILEVNTHGSFSAAINDSAKKSEESIEMSFPKKEIESFLNNPFTDEIDCIRVVLAVISTGNEIVQVKTILENSISRKEASRGYNLLSIDDIMPLFFAANQLRQFILEFY